MTELRYELKGDLTRQKLEESLDEIWTELATNPDARAEAVQAGLDVDAIGHISRGAAITVEKTSAGFGPETILIAFLPVVAKITTDIWEKLILPRLQQRYGLDALEKKKGE